jgi:hypothetical protein
MSLHAVGSWALTALTTDATARTGEQLPKTWVHLVLDPLGTLHREPDRLLIEERVGVGARRWNLGIDVGHPRCGAPIPYAAASTRAIVASRSGGGGNAYRRL